MINKSKVLSAGLLFIKHENDQLKSIIVDKREHSGSVVECSTRDRGGVGSSLTGVTVVCSWARLIYPCLVLVQPSKTHPDITEKLLTGSKESNQTKQSLVINCKGALAIRRIFSLVDMITRPKFSNCPNVFKIGLFR